MYKTILLTALLTLGLAQTTHATGQHDKIISNDKKKDNRKNYPESFDLLINQQKKLLQQLTKQNLTKQQKIKIIADLSEINNLINSRFL